MEFTTATALTLAERAASWCDTHSGVLSLIIFVATLLIGWVSGIFKALRQKPDFYVTTIEGPTFATVVPAQDTHNGHSTHRVATALYLSITNRGNAPSGISKIIAAYKTPPTSLKCLFSGRWREMRETIALSSFTVEIGESVKVYPFLRQKDLLGSSAARDYFLVGQQQNGLVYFEDTDLAYGSFRPVSRNGSTTIKLIIIDSFGRKHITRLPVPEIELEQARRFGKHVGRSIASLGTHLSTATKEKS